MKMSNKIDLRQEMADMLEEFGMWVLVLRNSKKIHCTCWNEKYQEGLSTCTKCGGTGWFVKLERHRTRKVGATIAISEPNLTQMMELGHSLISQYRWFFKHDVDFEAGDLIYEVLWDRKSPHKPVQIASTHYMNVTSDMRGDSGRVEYWEAATRSVTTNLKVENIIVRSMGPVKDYVLKGAK